MNSFNDCSLEHQYKNARNMKSYLLIIAIFVSICISSAQFNFETDVVHPKEIEFAADSVDNVHSKYFIKMDKKLDSTFKISKEFDFQFRLWKDANVVQTITAFIMTLNKGKWSASYYHFNPHWQEDCKYGMVRENVDSSKLNQLWHRLRQNNILKLPDDNKLREKKTMYEIDTTHLYGISGASKVFNDGTLYYFELIKPLQRRSFYYGNPEVSFKEYPYIKEYAQATMIIYLIKRYLGIPLTSPFR